VLQVHSAPPALCPHIEWAVAGVLGMAIDLPWVAQPVSPGMLRAELDWQAAPGTAGAITSGLAGWNRLRFEVTEEASAGNEPVRYSYTPDLGLFSAITMANGDIVIPESRLRAAMTVAAAAASGVVARPRLGAPGTTPDRLRPLADELSRLLGEPWDDELEPFRRAGDGAPVRWLHATG
jgi:hypothetical protein